MSDTSPALSLPLLMPSQAQKHVTHNEALMILDMVIQLVVAAFPLAAPPLMPAIGARYIVGDAATASWAGHENEIALWDGMLWLFVAPQPGWRADIEPTGESLRFTGGDWVPALPVLQNLPALGVGTSADASVPLAVAGPATLLTHAGAGHQLKLNKFSAGDTASLLFQTGWSGRAEMGTAGNDDFAIKVSADGSLWQEALRIGRADGKVHFPNGSPDLRERLTTPRSYYVRPDGDDGNTGLNNTEFGAFATVQYAIDLALTLDNGPYDVTIELAPGSYGEELEVAGGLQGSGPLQIVGNTGDPAAVSLSKIRCHRGARVAVSGVELTGDDALTVESGAVVVLADLRFEGSGIALSVASAEVSCSNESLFLGSGITTLARLRSHARLLAEGGSFILGAGITWGNAAFDLSGMSYAALVGGIFSGDIAGCTGQRFAVAQNAILDTGGAGGSAIPGSVSGSSESGGLYL